MCLLLISLLLVFKKLIQFTIYSSIMLYYDVNECKETTLNVIHLYLV